MSRSAPNILFIMADQLTAGFLGSYGHPTVQTPHLDGLAESGIQFDRAYCNCPICGPSRASLSTGKLVSEIEAYDNGCDFPASTPTFLHQLARGGYRTLLSGKMHYVGPDQRHGFQQRLTADIYPSSFVWTPDWSRGAYPNPGTSVEQLSEAGKCEWSMQLDYDEEVTFRSLEALRDLARSPADGPFFLCASYTHPHDPFIIHEPWWSLYPDEAVSPPTIPGRPLEAHHPFNQWLQIHHRIPEFPPRENWIRAARRAYLGMVSYFDHQVGLLLRELERLGLRDQTMVVVTSDHGEMLGEQGMWFKRTFYEPSVRVPLIISGPQVSRPKRVHSAVSLVDLYPTFIGIAGLGDSEAHPSPLSGSSLQPFFAGENPCHPGEAVIEYFSEGTCRPMRSIVRDDFKLVSVMDEDPLLFHLAEDPHEQINLFDDPEHQSVVRQLSERLFQNYQHEEHYRKVLQSQKSRRWIQEAHENGPSPDWDIHPMASGPDRYVRRWDAQETSKRRRI